MAPTRLKIDGSLQTRAAFEPSSFDAEKRTAEVVFTTGARGLRRSFSGSYYEELEVSEKAVDLTRLNNGASVLNSHASMDVRDVIGVVERAWIAGNEGRATIRFSDREEVQPIARDVQNGILRHISIGYSVAKYEEVGKEDDLPIYRAVRWSPAEVSIVPVAFDDGAVVRSRPGVEPYEVEVSRTEEIPIMGEKTNETATSPERISAEEATRAAATARVNEAKAKAESEQRAREEAMQAERERTVQIRKLVRTAKLGDDLADKLIEDGASVETVRAAVLDHLATASDGFGTSSHVFVEAGEDRRDKFVKGASAWLFERAGVSDVIEQASQKDPRRFKGVELDGGEFRGLSLTEIARESLERNGVKTRGMGRMDMVGLAFTHRGSYQTTSDFSVLLENVLHKAVLGAYAITDDTWSKFCKVETVADFRASNRYRTGSLGTLDLVGEHGEFKNKALPDGAKTSISVQTKGNIIGLSRQTIVNDDMGALLDVATKLGRAARLSIESDVYALLALNSGLGPTQSDSAAFFHANRANVATQAALSAAALDADATVMAIQKDISANEYLDLKPAVLLVPRALLLQAKNIIESAYDPDTVANKAQLKPNVARGIVREVVGTPRLSGTRRYLFAEPSIAPAIVVAFLEGQGQAPVLDSENGWRVDGVEWKVRLDYKAQMFDPKGAVTNAG